MTTETDKPATLAAAMARAFGEIEAATKSAANPHFKSRYADLSGVIEAIKPALVANGLFFTQRPEPSQGGVQIETVLHHEGGETLSLGSLFVPANKNDAQAYGSALTYARRYALVTAFGVPTEDDDGNAASKAPVEPAKRQNYGGRYPTATALRAGHKVHDAELRRLGHESNLDDYEGYITSPEYTDFITACEDREPALLHGGDNDPDGFIPIYKLERVAKSAILKRHPLPNTMAG